MTAAFVFIFVTVLLDNLAVGIVIPVLPGLIVQFRGGDTASAASIYGLFGTTWAAMQFIFSPVLGSLSDRFGRRKVILLSNVGLGLDYLLMAMAPTLPWLFVGRVISGITSSSIPTATAYIADVTPPAERAAKFGLLGAALGVGFIVGPTVGGFLGGISLRAPFWGAAILSLANATYGFFILPESLPEDRRSPFHWLHANPIGAFAMLRSNPMLFGLGFASFLLMLAHDSLPTTAVLYVTYRYGWTTQMLGLMFGVFGVAMLIVQAGLVGRIVAMLGERRALTVGLLCGAAGMIVFGWAPTGAWYFLGVPFIAVYGVATPALQSLMTRVVGPNDQGRLQGASSSMNGIANVAAPILFSQAFALAIGRYKNLNQPGAPFMLAAALLVAASVVAWRVTPHGADGSQS
jgi:DHA1 family tetracycline resistance protein-like MFS transporter